MGNLKVVIYSLVAVAFIYVFLNGDQRESASTAQLDQVLGIASNTVKDFENTADVNQDNAMEKFAVKYNEGLNAAEPPIHSSTLGTVAHQNGSLLSFDDLNSNGIQDEGENSLFMMEVDSENKQLVATDREESRSSGFSGSGLLMGMMIGNMLSRQRATGTNPAARRTTARGTPSARKRSRSGSHSRGK